MPPRTASTRSTATAFDLQAWLSRAGQRTDRLLRALLPPESTRPSTIHRAMRYSVFAGGKRLRPALCLAAGEACRGSWALALPAACAVECIHTYSLIHDDLPAMDNDDFRRGKPTSHKVFGEGMAILAGDALLTLAFDILATAKATPRYSQAQMVRELAHAAGSLQLIAGQVADLEAEGQTVKPAQLRFIHECKTSALLCCAVRLGGMSANCSPRKLQALTLFGRRVGLAFQIIDDILDVTQPSHLLGKTAGKDVAAGKATYPAVIGLEKSMLEARRLTAGAFEALRIFNGQAQALEALATHLLKRDR